MLNIHIICVGKLKERFYADAVAEFSKRLSRYCKLSIEELPESRLPDEPSPADLEGALLREAQAIEGKLLRNGAVIALCIEGDLLSSEALTARIQEIAERGQSRITFLIGGSMGLHETVKERATIRLSMSRMTFPHHLARVMLLEQIYRVFKIEEGSKYHK